MKKLMNSVNPKVDVALAKIIEERLKHNNVFETLIWSSHYEHWSLFYEGMLILNIWNQFSQCDWHLIPNFVFRTLFLFFVSVHRALFYFQQSLKVAITFIYAARTQFFAFFYRWLIVTNRRQFSIQFSAIRFICNFRDFGHSECQNAIASRTKWLLCTFRIAFYTA